LSFASYAAGMIDANDDALLRLVAAGGRAAARRTLLDRHASPAEALTAGARAWRDAGFDDAQIRAFDAPPREELQRWRDWLHEPGHHLLGWHHPDYPALLRRIQHPPLALFVVGEPTLLWHPAVAVVGSRRPSAGGRDHAFDFARAIAASGFAVTSGLAAGIDTAAHEGALAAGGPTVAVLGTGIDVPYPRRNIELHARIGAAGAVVSEYPPGTPPRPEQFPSRNRILAGLALGTLVVEAAERSGALITARLAGEAGREVFALPGSIHNPLARGCHRLIRDGAALIESAQELIAALGPMAGELGDALRERLGTPIAVAGKAGDGPAVLTPMGDPDYHRLWDALGHDPTGMDRLVERTGLTAAEVSSMLLLMELEGRVAAEHGRYSRKSFHHASADAGRGK